MVITAERLRGSQPHRRPINDFTEELLSLKTADAFLVAQFAPGKASSFSEGKIQLAPAGLEARVVSARVV